MVPCLLVNKEHQVPLDDVSFDGKIFAHGVRSETPQRRQAALRSETSPGERGAFFRPKRVTIA